MKTNAVQRSLKHLRENGWACHIVEKFLPKRGNMKFPRRIDAYGFGDILACKPKWPDGPMWSSGIALIQCCPGASHAAHKQKMLAIPELMVWHTSGGLIFLHSWSKKGPRGGAKRWTLREEQL